MALSLFSPLSDFFFYILEFLHGLGISWSWSIVLLTVIVRIVLIPLTWRQIKSMRAMQALAPADQGPAGEVQGQQATPESEDHGVLPGEQGEPLRLLPPAAAAAAGLLRPVLHAAQRRANRAACVRVPATPRVGWLWIPDITKFDIILMFLYIASQFVASWQMARKSAGQQKMIAYMMPIIVGIFMFIGKWPAGLFIYWFTSNLWTIAQQYVAERMMPVPVHAAHLRQRTRLRRRRRQESPAKAGERHRPSQGLVDTAG